MKKVKQFDNSKIMSDFVQGVNTVSMSTSTQVVLIRHLATDPANQKEIKPTGLKNSVQTSWNSPKVEFDTMVDWMDDAVKFDYNHRDRDYKNFHYALNTNKPRGMKLQKRFS
jgi:hypothetical protein